LPSHQHRRAATHEEHTWISIGCRSTAVGLACGMIWRTRRMDESDRLGGGDREGTCAPDRIGQ
jgi:hypothetical protein